jgi:hypothetical protein
MGVQVESGAKRRPACPMPAGGNPAGRRHALVPARCAGQREPGRCSVSLRTLAAMSGRSWRGGCRASPGRAAWGASPGCRTGLRAVLPGRVRGDDSSGFQFVIDGADGHCRADPAGGGLGLVGKAAGGDPLPRSGVAVSLPSALRASRPLPSWRHRRVRGLAVPQHRQAARAAPRRASRRDGHDGDALLGCDVPDPVHDPPAHRLREAGVHGAAHAPRFKRAEVL